MKGVTAVQVYDYTGKYCYSAIGEVDRGRVADVSNPLRHFSCMKIGIEQSLYHDDNDSRNIFHCLWYPSMSIKCGEVYRYSTIKESGIFQGWHSYVRVLSRARMSDGEHRYRSIYDRMYFCQLELSLDGVGRGRRSSDDTIMVLPEYMLNEVDDKERAEAGL